MKGTSIFSPSSWRKKRLLRTTSDTTTASSSQTGGWNSKSSPEERSWAGYTSMQSYSPTHAKSAVNLPSPKFWGEAPELPRSYPASIKSTLVSEGDQGSLDASSKSPSRPPRPPSLDLECPPLPPKKFELEQPRVSPKCQNTRSSSLRSKASLPELDGVWHGFLKEVDENPNSLRAGGKHGQRRPSNASSLSSRSNAAPRSSPRPSKRFGDLPPSPPFDKRQFDIAAISPLDLVNQPGTDGEDDVREPDSPHAQDFSLSLSLFPSPPPLNIRKKMIPKPLDLRNSSFSSLPVPPPSPSTSSSDSTPLATPSTPTQSSVVLSPRKSSNKDSTSPKYPLFNLSPTRPPNRSFASDSVVNSRLHTSRSFYQPSRNKSHELSANHRTTSSESISSCSSSENDLRERTWTFPPSPTFPSYLESSGRKPTSPAYGSVQWGIAV
ncbi:hypothetical protein V5O48_000092 [Marasmius crinis-equi]|uniref:Uncharacterized protein n=1 Tax=Marasmius crinis-equi TaxID=585013 RepID=A0ABR3G2W7_9AGAR